jgi:hypothetical protein
MQNGGRAFRSSVDAAARLHLVSGLIIIMISDCGILCRTERREEESS